MKIIKKYLGAFLLILIAVSFISVKPCFAASAKVELTSENTEVTIGDIIHVYIKIDSGSTFWNFEANLVYDESILEYQDGASVITGGDGFLRISDMASTQSDTSRKYVLNFKAIKVGSCNISFNNDVMVYDEFDNEMSVSDTDLTIKVKSKETASTNANLKSLITSPTNISPEFDKNVYEYSENVSYDTEKLFISAIPEDEKSTVSISGNDSLKEGENKVVVTVLAESGDIIEYTINVIREKAPENAVVTGGASITPGAVQSTFEIVLNNGEKYAVCNGSYKLLQPGSEVTIPEGYIQKEITISGVTINVYVPSNNTDTDFVLIYAEDAAGEKGFYQYDKLGKTLQRYVTGNAATDNVGGLSKYRSNLNKAAVVIALLSIICVLLIFISIRFYLKLQGHRKNEQ